MIAREIGTGVVAFLVLLFVSCASVSGDRSEAERTEAAGGARFHGTGRSESLLRAMNLAKMEAVGNAVVYLIGPEKEALHRGTLEEVLYGTENPNRYVHAASMETLRKDRIDGEYILEIRIAVDLRAIERVVETHGLSDEGDSADAAAERPARLVQQTFESSPEETTVPDAPAVPDGDERSFVRRYVDRMSYLVTRDDGSDADPALMAAAVGTAVEYLVASGMTVIDPAQVERLRTDQRMVWEAETGKDESIVQWIAGKLNADVYIEIAAATRGEAASDGGYAGFASATLKLFDASTGRILASVPDRGIRALSLRSERDAVSVALQSVIRRSMPNAVEQARSQMERALGRGVRYEVILQRTPDARITSRFRSNLMSRVKDVQTLSQSPEETRYAVFFLGRIEDLESLIYDTAATIPGMEGIFQIYLRGRTLTFDSGM